MSAVQQMGLSLCVLPIYIYSSRVKATYMRIYDVRCFEQTNRVWRRNGCSESLQQSKGEARGKVHIYTLTKYRVIALWNRALAGRKSQRAGDFAGD